MAAVAYQTTVERIGLALLGADVVVIAAVGVAAWVLAARTLEPIGEAHARQRRFVADASHEMRTPLAAILSSAEGAIATAHDPDELRKALTVNVRAARSLTAITNDLLLLARSDELPSDRRELIDLSVVVAETVEAFAAVHPELPPIRMSLARICVCPPIQPRSVGSSRTFSIMPCAYGTGPSSSSSESRHAPSIATQSSRSATTDQDSRRTSSSASSSRSTESAPKSHRPRGRSRVAIARSLAEGNGGRLTVTSGRNRRDVPPLSTPVHVTNARSRDLRSPRTDGDSFAHARPGAQATYVIRRGCDIVVRQG